MELFVTSQIVYGVVSKEVDVLIVHVVVKNLSWVNRCDGAIRSRLPSKREADCPVVELSLKLRQFIVKYPFGTAHFAIQRPERCPSRIHASTK